MANAGRQSPPDQGEVGLDMLFAALANSDRLALLRALSVHRERGYAEGVSIAGLALGTEISRFAASRHLAILRDVGLVHCNEVGRARFHSLNVRRFEQVEDWLYDVLHQIGD